MIAAAGTVFVSVFAGVAATILAVAGTLYALARCWPDSGGRQCGECGRSRP